MDSPSEDLGLLLNRAIAYMGDGKALKALGDFEAVLEKKPNEPRAVLGRAEIFLRQGRFSDAKDSLPSGNKKTKDEEAMLKRIEEAEKKFEGARKLMEAKDWDRANRQLESLQIQERIDLSKQIYALRAECYTWQHKFLDAVRMYQGRATLEQDSSETEYEAGKLYLAMGNLKKGSSLIDDCARSNPDHQRAMALRKKLKSIQGTIDKAGTMLFRESVVALEGALAECAKIDPSALYYDEKLPEMLLKPFELSLSKLLCNKYIRLKDTGKAIERCQRVLDLTTGNVAEKGNEEAAFLSMSEAFAMAEKYEEAVALLKRAQSSHPRSQRVHEALQKVSQDLRKSKQRDYYKILGVPRTATEDEIRKAFTRQARQCHPDKVKNKTEAEREEASKKMQELNAALSVLTDEKKRAQFDAGYDPEDPQAGHPGAGGGFGGGFGGFGGFGGGAINIEDLFRQAHHQQRHGPGGHGGYGGGQRQQYQYRHQQQRRGQQRRDHSYEDFSKFDL